LPSREQPFGPPDVHDLVAVPVEKDRHEPSGADLPLGGGDAHCGGLPFELTSPGTAVEVSDGDVQAHGRLVGAEDVRAVADDSERNQVDQRIEGELRDGARVGEQSFGPVAGGGVEEPGSAAAW
jgi:hypothetical protein